MAGLANNDNRHRKRLTAISPVIEKGALAKTRKSATFPFFSESLRVKAYEEALVNTGYE